MIRSVGIAAVVLGLAWSGFAGAQPASPSGAVPSPPRYIKVSEEGKKPQRCILLKSWQEPNGSPAFQVRALDTGEVMTILGSSPSANGGDPRAMSTRIFRWGSGNKPPAGAPVPPPTASAWAATPQVIPPAAIQSAPNQFPTTPRSTPATLTARKPALAPPAAVVSPTPAQPTLTLPAVSPSKPTASVGIGQTNPAGSGGSRIMTPMSTPVIQQPLVRTPAMNNCTPSTPPQPRLIPSATEMVVGSKPGDCSCPTSCNACCQPCNPCCPPCNPCGQPSCVCCPPSPMRQSFISRLFNKSPRQCECSEVACQPTPPPAPKPAAPPPPPAVAKVATEPAKPRDWRESWGEIKPWKAPKETVQAAPVNPAETVTQRVAPTPVQMDAPKDPDPLKNPDLYRDMALNARPANSNIPEESQPRAASKPKSWLFSAKSHEAKPAPPPPQQAMAASGATPSAPSPLRSPGRVVQLPANEPNAFSSPPEAPPANKEPKPKFNAFQRDENSPPQGGPPRIAPGYSGPLPPPGPMPMVRQRPLPNMPSRPDMGVPDAMANAFTLAGTRRPIPADFGGTPQEPNGFDPNVQMGQGSPPLAYGMGMPGMPRPPMPNRMAMGPHMPMGVNPLMSVPATAVPSMGQMAAAHPAGVPQLLAKLKDSLYPSEREAAAEQLSELNWRGQPQVVASLMKSAHDDPAATVRAACVHALAHMKVASTEAVALVRGLKSDRDPRVRQEAEEALNALGNSGIQQASHK